VFDGGLDWTTDLCHVFFQVACVIGRDLSSDEMFG